MSGFSWTTRLSGVFTSVSLCALIVTGEIVAGVTCPALLTDDGTTVALSRLPASFEIGDRVTVTGSGYAGSSTCQQEVLIVTDVSTAD